MTTATLSFATHGCVTLLCSELGLDERRDLEAATPFAAWTEEYRGSPAGLLELGLRIAAWIDGGQWWLGRLFEHAAPPLVLEIEVAPRREPLELAVLDVPWELIAAMSSSEARHLALDPTIRLGVVRRVGPAGDPRPPQPYRLSVVFMAALPAGVDGLEVDQRDCEFLESIDRIGLATEALGAELVVEESGSLDRLNATAHARQCDVIHLCGAVTPREPAGLIFELEDDGTERVVAVAGPGAADRGHAVATPGELHDRLSGYQPSLLVLSADATGAGAAAGLQVAAELCRRGWPAVLAWAGAVADRGALDLTGAVYRQLAGRRRLVDAVADARDEGRPWHQARLFLGAAGGDRLIDEAKPREIRVRYPADFLDARRTVGVWKRSELYGYRRAVQRTLAALRLQDSTAVALHGAGAQLRASLAARIAASVDDLRRIVIGRKDQDDELAILRQISGLAANAEVDRTVRAYEAQPAATRPRLTAVLRELLEGACQRAGGGAVLLVIHDLRLRRPRSLHGQLALAPRAPPVVSELVEAFHGAATESRLLLTSAHPFAIYTAAGKELIGHIRFEPRGGIVPPPLSLSRLRAKATTKIVTGMSAATASASVTLAATSDVLGSAGQVVCLAAAAAAAVIFAIAARPVSPRAGLTAGNSVLAMVAAVAVAIAMLAGFRAQVVDVRAALAAQRDDRGEVPIAVPIDAGIDAPIDAPDDAGIDAPVDAIDDAGIDAPIDAAVDAELRVDRVFRVYAVVCVGANLRATAVELSESSDDIGAFNALVRKRLWERLYDPRTITGAFVQPIEIEGTLRRPQDWHLVKEQPRQQPCPLDP